ncbi:MAG: putative dehydrogenase [Bacteroidia bacterium]
MRIGIIGVGNFSSKVLEYLRAIDTLTVVGGYDSLVLDRFKSYGSLEDMLPEVDSVLVFDILYSSFASLSVVIKYGKNLYIETPGLCTNRELRGLEMLGYESGSVVQIGQKQRYYSFYDDLAKYDLTPRIIESSRFVKFNKKSTQLSVIDDLMLHDIDVTLMIANAEVKSVYSTAVGVYYKDPDVVNTRIEFYNGCVANLSASKISNKEVHQAKVFQNNTYCSIDYVNQLLKVQSNTGVEEGSSEEWGVKTTYRQAKDTVGYISMVEKEINSFYHCIINNIEPISGIPQYLQLQSVTDKIKEQLERNFTTNV